MQFKNTFHCLVIAIIFIGVNRIVYAQTPPAPLTKNEKKQVVDSIGKILNDYYIFPDIAKKAADFIAKNFSTGVYESISDPHEFASKLTNDVVSVNNDKHFHVFFDPERVEAERNAATSKEDSLALVKEEIENGIRDNFGLKEVKILDGNIGYLRLSGFHPLQYAVETINGAMRFLSNTNALILDVRSCQGGDSEMGQYIISFFVNPDPTLLYDLYIRDGNNTIHKQFYTFPYVNGKRRPDVDIYILTSKFAFSAPEGLAYSLQRLKRATVIGESTGGGAHMWTGKIATERFYVHVPFTKPVDPVTKTNWEGIGVKPDINVPAKDALITAQIKTLEKLVSTDPANATPYNWHLAAVKAKLKDVIISPSALKSYAGKYGNISIAIENGKLYCQRKGINCELIPMTETLFRMEEFNFFRIQMILEKDLVKGIMVLNDNGSSRTFLKEK